MTSEGFSDRVAQNSNLSPASSGFQSFTDKKGQSLSYQIVGGGVPPIILDAGFQYGPATWAHIAAELATFTTAIVLDRSTLLDPMRQAVDGNAAYGAGQITQLLECVDIRAPFISVGWAYGNIYTCALAARNPSDVLGIVLVDYIPEEFVREIWAPSDAHTSEYCAAIIDEIAMLRAVLRNESFRFPDSTALHSLPVTHISRGSQPPKDDLIAQRWLELQSQYLQKISSLREVIAGRSGHSIPIDRPDVITDAVRELMSR